MNQPRDELNIEYPFQMLTLILSEDQYKKCARMAREINIYGGLVILGRGTVNSSVLNLLGIKSQKKEVVYFILEKEKAREVLDYFTRELQLLVPGHGIAFTSPVIFTSRETDISQVAGISQVTGNTAQDMEGKSMYKKLTVIVDRGMAADVMDIARKAGATGGTIIHGRGTGAEFTEKLFGMEIEPEKEVVMILMPGILIDKVVNALFQELKMQEPGHGILYVEPVNEVRGLIDSHSEGKDTL